MRLDRPIGVWLLLWPSLWSIALAADSSAPEIQFHLSKEICLYPLFGIGAIVMRGAGCVINDLWDRDLDKMVERTRTRPIASGQISPKQALVFLALLLCTGLIILLQLGLTTILLGCAVIPLIILYPLMKRITYWPQAFLGLTFNFGALMGWSAYTGSIELPALLLYLGSIAWTIGYDTIYAHQDKEDDIMAGIKSTALKFEDNGKFWIIGFYACAVMLFISALFTKSALTLQTACILPIAFLSISALHILWQIWAWKPDNPENALKIFKSNRYFGALLWGACLFWP